MSISPELMYAILVLDSYNQGYGEGIEHEKTDIGTASLFAQSDIEDGEAGVDAGFYAAAYTYNNETVISYRGTNSDELPNFVTDAWNGYFVSVGSPFNDQARLAAAFYSSVEGDDLYNADISFTGHSPGGGLAGMTGRPLA